jgi:hypothetical protein
VRIERGEGVAVSVIIPVHRDTDRFRFGLTECLMAAGLVPGEAEVIVVSDRVLDALPEGVVGVVTNAVGDTAPGQKRDVGLASATGRLIAFIDDDAYPRRDWLVRGVRRLDDPRIAAVGGPGLTPLGSPWRERLGGAVYESRLGSGSLRKRFVQLGGLEEVREWPAFNLFVRQSALSAAGGWACDLYGGEDTKMCGELTRRGYRIVYDSSVVVYHFRRPVFRGHMRQVANVGYRRGSFIGGRWKDTRMAGYCLPSLGMGLLPVWLGLFGWLLATWWFAGVALVVAIWLALSVSVWVRAGAMSCLYPLALVAHHCAYGWNFIRGLRAGRCRG